MKKLFLLLLPFSLLAEVQPTITFTTNAAEWGKSRINAYVNEQHAGYLEYHAIPQNTRIIYIDLFFINPEFRNKKIGTLLMLEALNQFDAQYCTHVVLQAFPFGHDPRMDLETLMNFYRKFGFRYIMDPNSSESVIDWHIIGRANMFKKTLNYYRFA